MKVYKMLVDKKPEWCLLCPLAGSSVKIDMPDCGSNKTVDAGDGWTQGGKAPDSRCILVEVQQ